MLQTTGHVELQKLGVVPQTVFLGTRASSIDPVRRLSDRYSLSRVSSNDLSPGTAPVVYCVLDAHHRSQH